MSKTKRPRTQDEALGLAILITHSACWFIGLLLGIIIGAVVA